LVKKTKTLNLDLNKLDEKTLTSILSRIESTLKDFLDKKLPPKSEYDLILSISKEEDKITLLIDVGIKGGYSDIYDYDTIIGDAINVARKEFERIIKQYKKNTENTS